nr:MAG: hypothetical protein [Bacteriophage sp.]
MKVHRIITTIEVENDNSITSIELINLHPTNSDIPLAITNLTTNGNADDIKQVYTAVDDRRGFINDKLKSIAHILNDCFDTNKLDEVIDDNDTNETDDNDTNETDDDDTNDTDDDDTNEINHDGLI